MSPVGRAEGVVDIDLAQGGQFLGKLRIIVGLPLVESNILQQEDLAVLQSCGRFLGLGADAVPGEGHRLAQSGGQGLGHDRE